MLSAGTTALLVNIFERKAEARDPYLRLTTVTEAYTDPRTWADNWPRQYGSYALTALLHAR